MESSPLLLNRIASSEAEAYGIHMIGCVSHTPCDPVFLHYSNNKNNIVYYGPSVSVSIEIKEKIISIDEIKRVQEMIMINQNIIDVISGKKPSILSKNYITDKFECNSIEESYTTALQKLDNPEFVLIFLTKERRL